MFSVVHKVKADNYTSAKRAVCHYFKSDCNDAMRVVGCETGRTYSVWAKNGQYLGLFQMGNGERRRWGHGNNVWAQAKAAYAYFEFSYHSLGYKWHPWSCQP